MNGQAKVTCFWCNVDAAAEAWNAPDDPLPITHEMLHAFLQAFPDIEPRSFADLEPQDYLRDDIYFSTTEWPIFDVWAVQQGYWPIDAILARAVARDKNEKHTLAERAAYRSTRTSHQDELPF
jgi:hypothetical protein